MKLLNKIKNLLVEAGPLSKNLRGSESSSDLRLAVTVIALRAAYSDKRFAPEEHQEILTDLTYQFGMSKSEVESLIEEAKEYQKFDGWVKAYIEQINGEFNVDQRIEILSLVWRIIESDDFVEEREEEFVTSLALRLALSEEEAQEAKRRSEP